MKLKLPKNSKLILVSTLDVDDGVYIDKKRYAKYLREVRYNNTKYIKYYNALLIELENEKNKTWWQFLCGKINQKK